MSKFVLLSLVCTLWLSVAASADAQVVHTTFYQPMTVFHAPPTPVAVTAFHSPVPVTTFHSPTPVVAFQPTTVIANRPVVAWQPTAVTETRRRPILGGTVSRTRIQNMPVVVNQPVMVAF